MDRQPVRAPLALGGAVTVEPERERRPEARGERRASALAGSGFAFVVFVLIALAQMIGSVELPKGEIEERITAFEAPELVEIEEEPPPEEEEPPAELEEEPPALSLD